MENIVKLEDIIEGLEIQSDEMRVFLNLRNGEVITISDEEIRAAEDEALIEEFPTW
ncbi:hypothetical protein [Alkaliphilus peptidifermentans]|uniref:Uncharacterized protein n=1 Tax=Alkaliphilus peptidifermentans DSM 18978 TaxID=1120976 RepID=A0A1G5L6G5_9FIRM|nr:hypothetical protein [Alkaliphilus peptidifermentans]SCZ08543.1 hypothetical protein SAMN03080606_04129 [Alkaliphilus peptidifermentans DSM 18978]